MSEKTKSGLTLIVVLLVGMTLGSLGTEMLGEGGRIVEVEPCPEPPEVLECTLVCPEPVCEAPVVEIPPCPACPPCTCAHENEYGCLNSIMPEEFSRGRDPGNR